MSTALYFLPNTIVFVPRCVTTFPDTIFPNRLGRKCQALSTAYRKLYGKGLPVLPDLSQICNLFLHLSDRNGHHYLFVQMPV